MNQSGGAGLNAGREALPLSSSPRFPTFSDDLPPIVEIYWLAKADVGDQDDDRLEARDTALELDMLGCLDARL